MSYRNENEAKASFDDAYDSPTPHAYLEEMRRLGYQIGEQARPFCRAAVELLQETDGEARPVQMLDLGCSYGLGSVFVKYGASFEEIVSFFHSRAPREPQACAAATWNWLNVVPPTPMRVVGLDLSERAVRFGLDSGLLDGGIARNFEAPDVLPDDDERAWLRGCNLMISTGAIGYVTERSLDKLLPELGLDHSGETGPTAVLSILRVFDPAPIRAAFERAGWSFERIDGVLLPQRAFADAAERDAMIAQIEARGLDTAELEQLGVMYAGLFVAARQPAVLDALVTRMHAVADATRGIEPLFAPHAEVAVRGCAANRD